jgi:predicted AAA+ superfamily ATPase
MIPRLATSTLIRLAKGFPVVALTGPRQSGKTTLAKHVFPNKTYVSLENPEELEFAQKDPKRFLARLKKAPSWTRFSDAHLCSLGYKDW